jgi:hypothetical protein
VDLWGQSRTEHLGHGFEKVLADDLVIVGLDIQRGEKQIYEQAEGWTDWRDFKIVNKVKESEEITSFYLSPVGFGWSLSEYCLACGYLRAGT